MLNIYTKLVPIEFVKLGGKEIEVSRIVGVLEDLYDNDDGLNDYDLDTTAADILVSEGVLKNFIGSRQASIYAKTNKFKEFYETIFHDIDKYFS